MQDKATENAGPAFTQVRTPRSLQVFTLSGSSCDFRESPLREGGGIRFDGNRSRLGQFSNGVWVKNGEWSRGSGESKLRKLLLPSESSLRDRSGCAVSDLPSGASGWPAAAQPAPVRFPAGAAHAGGLGIPLAQRASRAPRLIGGLVYLYRHVLAVGRRTHSLHPARSPLGLGHGHEPSQRRRQRRSLTG
jgi:hypothetical protein